MRVPKYKDIVRLTLFGRYDKLLNDTTSIYQGYDRVIATTGGPSTYQNVKRLRFDFNQELAAIKLADGAQLYLEYVRMPALANSSCFKNLRLIGGLNLNIYDSVQGTTGNPILFSCESGNVATNYFLSDTAYCRLSVPSNLLNRGYIEFELDTVATANVAFSAAQLNELIIKLVIEEPQNEQTQDINLAPEFDSAKTFHVNINLNHRI